MLDFEKDLVSLDKRIAELKQLGENSDADFSAEIENLMTQRQKMAESAYASLTPWQTVQVARHPERPMLRDWIGYLCSDFTELHGDRNFGDDNAIIGGFATIGAHRLMLVGHQKGKNVEENLLNNFGMGRPEGYRKALRLMKLAEKFGLPVLCLIDTPGAYPGMDAEERGQAEAIARNILEMADLETPIVVLVTGEGGSGGALGIGVGDVVLMMQYAVYSVISPEGCASILWRDGAKAPEAAAALKLTAASLLELGVVDGIIPEPPGGAHSNPQAAAAAVRPVLLKHFKRLSRVQTSKLVSQRFEKYSKIGRYR